MYTLNDDIGCITTLDIPGIILLGRKVALTSRISEAWMDMADTIQHKPYYKNLQAELYLT